MHQNVSRRNLDAILQVMRIADKAYLHKVNIAGNLLRATEIIRCVDSLPSLGYVLSMEVNIPQKDEPKSNTEKRNEQPTQNPSIGTGGVIKDTPTGSKPTGGGAEPLSEQLKDAQNDQGPYSPKKRSTTNRAGVRSW